jgi:hypothetical protein
MLLVLLLVLLQTGALSSDIPNQNVTMLGSK